MEKVITVYEVLGELGKKEINNSHLDEINRLVSEAYKNKTGSFSTHLIEKKVGGRTMLVKAYPLDFHFEMNQISQQYFKLMLLTNTRLS